MEKMSWTKCVKKYCIEREERNMLHTIQRMKANWIGHIMRRNRFIKHVI